MLYDHPPNHEKISESMKTVRGNQGFLLMRYLNGYNKPLEKERNLVLLAPDDTVSDDLKCVTIRSTDSFLDLQSRW